MQLTEKERAWLLERPHLVMDQRYITRLQDTFNIAQERGLERDSPEYMGLFNERFGKRGDMSPAQREICKQMGWDETEYMKNDRKMRSGGYDSASLYGVRR